MSLTRRLFLTSAASALSSAALAEAPLTALRPPPRPGRATPAPAGQPEAPPLRPDLEDLVQASGLGDGVSVRLIDLASGDILADRLPDRQMMPASVTKAVTALYALDHLGADHRFATRILGTGPVREGVVQGDLVLAGGGDPTLDTAALDAMVARMEAQGINAITGRLKVWAGALPYEEEIEPGQLDHLGYNPSVSGLNLNFNRVHFEWHREGGSYRVALDARAGNLRPAVSFARMRVIDRSLPVYTSEGRDDWTVARGALGSGGSRWLPVRQPGIYAGEVLRVLAEARGLRLPAPERTETLPAGTELARHESAPLTKVLKDMLYYSTNLTAEVVGLAASISTGTRPAGIRASADRMNEWLRQRYGITGGFVDHSGLSDANRVSAATMAGLLQNAPPERLRPILKDVEIRNAPDYPGDVAAKTGTLNFVSALAGYVTTRSGRELAFSIFCADAVKRAGAVASGDEIPAGAPGWNAQAKLLQDRLLRRWSLMA